MKKFLRPLLGAITSLIVILFLNNVLAEGSKEVISNGGSRPFLEDNNGTYTFGSTIITRTNIFYVYTKTGEKIYLGSSAQGIGNGRINYTSPTGTTGTCITTSGIISSITGELAGPLPNTGGYIPCIVNVTTGQAGIWTIRFVSPSPTSVANPIAIDATGSWAAQATTNGFITAWDITVRSSTGTNMPGRMFTPYINSNVGSYAATFNTFFYIKTQEGFLHHVFTNHLQSFVSLFFADNKGLYDSVTGNPLFVSMLGANISGNVKLNNPMELDTTGHSTHKIFFNTPDPSLPANAPSASGSMWLNTSTTSPSLSNFFFVGYDGTTGQGGTYPLGGYFKFNSNTDGLTYTIVDLNDDGIYGNANDAILSGFTVSGQNSTFWNALDGLGSPVPGSGSKLLQVKIIINGRGIHFPLYDAEENTSGLIISRVNGLNAPDYTIHYDDTLLGGFKTNILSGENSFSGAHKRTGSNNALIDTWSFIPSVPQYLTSVVIFNESDFSITKMFSGSYIRGSTGNYIIAVTNSGPANASGANVIDTFSSNFLNPIWSCKITAGTGIGNSCGSGTGNINKLITLYNGNTATYFITGTISSSATGLFNSGVILRPFDDNDPSDPYRTGSGNNGAIVSGAVISPSDLLINITPNRGGYISGDKVTYTIRYQNSGTDTLPITITGALPTGITGWSISTGLLSGGIFSINFPPVGPNTSGFITLSGTVITTGGIITLTGIISSDIQDINTGNNSASASITVALCPFVVTSGFALSYTEIGGVTNPGNATGAVDTLVASIGNGDSIVLDMGTGFVTGTTFVLRIGKIGGGGTASATIEQSLTGATFSNSQTYSSGTVGLENFNYTTTVGAVRYIRVTRTAQTIQLDAISYTLSGYNCPTVAADIGITKTVNISSGALSGNILIYTLSYFNLGDDTATGITISDILPTGLTGLKASTGTFSGNTFSKTGITLTSNQTGSLTISGSIIITSGSLANTASITTSTLDPYTGNNSSSTITTMYVDTVPPSITLIAPTSGAILSGNTLFTRSGSDNVAVSGYVFKVYNSSGTQIYSSGLTTTGIFFNTGDGNYTRTIIVTDTAGNSTTGTNRSFTMDKTSPTASISYAPGSGSTTSGNVFATLTGFSETLTGLNTTGHLFTGNGSFTFTYTDLAGNTGATTATVTRIDKTPPTASISYAPGSGSTTSGNVFATLTGFSETLTGLNATGHLFTGNGSFTFTYTDLAGNTGVTTATVTRIDKIPPTASISYAPGSGSTTSGNVFATLTGFSETLTGLNTTGHLFTGNGSFTFTYTDLAGNTGATTATVTRIDKTPPTASISYAPGSGSTTSGNVFATLTGFSETLTGLNATGHLFTGNGSFTFTYTDLAGNTGATTATVTRIDKISPTASINYAPATLTSGNVFATITGFSETTTGLNATGFLFTGNGSFIFTYTDLAGNTGSTTATVTRIDKTSPTASINYAPATLTSGNVFATITGFSETTTGLNATGHLFTGNGSFTFTYTDLAGNTGATTATVTRIDKTSPTASISYAPATLTSGNVFATITGFSETVTGLNATGHLFTGNGSFTFTYTDLAGNTGATTATVTRIDKTPPTASISYSITGLTNQNVIATLTGYSESITLTNNSGVNTYTFTGNNSFTFTYTDLAGNTGATTATVTRIDKINPIVTLNGSGTIIIPYGSGYSESGASRTDNVDGSGTNVVISGSVNTGALGTYLLTYSYTDQAGNIGSTIRTVQVVNNQAPIIILNGPSLVNVEFGSNYTESGATWTDIIDGSGTISTPTSGSVNTGILGTYTLTYSKTNTSGLTGNVDRIVNIVDTTPPTITLNGSGTITLERLSPYVESGATRTDIHDGSGTVSIITGSVNTGTVGIYTITYTKIDTSGNTGSTTRTIYVVDTISPTASISYVPATLTSGNVFATITGFSETVTGLNATGFLFTGNGSFTFTYTDLAGNTGATTATVTRIDKINPTASIEYAPATLTSGNVFATITGFSETTTGLNATGYLFTGNGSFTFTYTDLAGNTGATTATVTRIDKIPPTTSIIYSITGLTNQNVIATLSGFSETITGLNATGHTFTGNNSFTFTYQDLAGNTGSNTATVTWIDKINPVVTINGSGTINVEFGTNYNESDATRTDNIDGSGTVSIISGSVNTGTLGIYILTYKYIDQAGNSGTNTRTVNVIDTTSPSVTLIGSGTITIERLSSYTESGATRTDIHDGSGTIPAPTSGSVNTGTVGIYILEYTKVDISGNTGTVTRTVNVIDTTPPTASIIYSITGLTNQNVISTITGFSEPSIILNNGGLSGHTFTTNGEFVYEFEDLEGNPSVLTATVTRIDKINPIITLNGSGNTNVEFGTNYNESGATRTDNVDGSGTVAIITGVVNTGTLGAYTVTYKYIDQAGNSGTNTRTVNVVDTTSPTVTLIGSGVITLERLSTYIESGATRTDIHDGSGTIPTPTTGTVNTSLSGTYILTYSKVDISGNTGTVSRTVNVIDTTPPTANIIYSITGLTNQNVIATLTGYSEMLTITNNSGVNTHTFTGNTSFIFNFVDVYGNTGSTTATVTRIDKINPIVTINGSGTVYVSYGSGYTESGASRTDNVDGSGIVSIISGSVNTGALGTYILTYIYIDQAGNSGSDIRTVYVINTNAPVVTLNGSGTINIEYPSSYVESGATRTDLIDGSGTISVPTSGIVNTGILGTYTLEYRYINTSGLTGTVIRTVNVVDTTAPSITLIGSGTITLERLSTYVESGATRSDIHDGSGIIATPTSGSVNTSLSGTYILQYTKADISGNTGTVTRTVYVVDTTPPTASIIYSITGLTNQNVAAILTGFSESITITNNSGMTVYTFTGNNSFIFNFVDVYGNTGSTTAIVTRIDKIKPLVTINGSSGIILEYGSNYIESGAIRTDNVDGSGTNVVISGNVNTGALGIYNRTYTYTDQAGNTGNDTRTITIVDTTAPSITLVGSGTVTLERLSTYVESGATRSDIHDGSGIIATPTTGTVDTSTVGAYTLQYTKVDSSGNTGTVSRTVYIFDTVSPTASVIYSYYTLTNQNVIATLTGASEAIIITNNSGSSTRTFTGNGNFTFQFEDVVGNTGIVTATVTRIDKIKPIVTLNGSGTINTEFGTNYIESYAQRTDNVDGSGTNTVITGSVNTGVLGAYILTYTYTDQASNTGNITRTVNVVDTTPPTITLSGANVINIWSGNNYSEYGATRTDAHNGSGAIPIPTSGSVNTGLAGTYILTYSKVDSSGNTGTVTRTVNVIDNSIPIVTLNGLSIMNIQYGSGYSESGAYRTDSTDGTGTIPTPTSGSVNTGILGTYNLQYRYVNSLGITGSITRTVNIVDTIAPNIILNGSSTVIVEYGSSYTESGATWTDLHDGSGTIPIPTYGSVNTGILGIYTLSYTKVDTSGNTGTVTRTVHVVDTIAPNLTLIGSSNITFEYGSVNYIESGASRSDIHDGSGIIPVPTSGSINTGVLGTYILQYKKIDSSGNTGTVTRTVNIVDTTAPNILLNGTSTVIIEYGVDNYIESGATWTDTYEGSGIISTPTSGSVNTGVLGTYILKYKKIDSSGNSGTVTRNVNIVDTTTPNITLIGSGYINIPWSFTYVESGATRTDIHDGSGNIPIPTSGSVNVSTIATYILEYTKIDISGNTGMVTRTVQVGENNVRPTFTTSGSCIDYDGCICNAGVIAYDQYCTITPPAPPAPPGGGGGGGGGGGPGPVPSTGTIFTGTIFTGVIFTGTLPIHPAAPEGPIITSEDTKKYSKEMLDAYRYAFARGITTMNTTNKAQLDGPLLRKQLAKMISEYATKVVGLIPNNSKKCEYPDIGKESNEFQYYIRLSCKLGVMGLNADGISVRSTFMPNELVNRAQFGTVFSRLIFGGTFNVKNENTSIIQQPDYWYKSHLQALKDNAVMTKIEPFLTEIRGFVMIMMMRADQNGVITAYEDERIAK